MKWVLYPICKPLAWLLDLILGSEHKNKGVTFSQKELKLIMNEISRHPDDKLVVEGALKLGTVKDSIIEWKDVICFDANKKLDALGLLEIFKTGYSRIPVYEDSRDNIIGVLLVKALIFCDPDPELTIKQYLMQNFRRIHSPALVQSNTPLYDCLNTFQKQKTHFAMVCEKEDEGKINESWENGDPIPDNVEWKGIITLEDIMEDLIQEPIADEFDTHKFDGPSPSNIQKRKVKWTDDESFAESTISRYSAKNMRTARAVENAKTWKERSFNRNDDGKIKQDQIVEEDPEKPLLSNIDNDTSINVVKSQGDKPSLEMDDAYSDQ